MEVVLVTKSDLVKNVTDKVDDITASKTSDVINAVFESITEGLEIGDKYNQERFGTFKVVRRAPRKGRNPRTGEEIQIPAKNAVKFVTSGILKDKINDDNSDD
jgi:nucleoid DNA-binding protein